MAVIKSVTAFTVTSAEMTANEHTTDEERKVQ